MCNNFASTKRALNFVHFSGNEPRMAKSAQNWRICPYGNGKFSIPDKVTQFTLPLLNVPIPVPQKCPADTCHKNQSFKRYSRFSSKNVIFLCFRTRFSRISPHGQKSRKSDLLQNLIIYRYGAACKCLRKSYGKFLKFRIFGGYFVYVFSGAAPGPSPSLKVDLLREKANAHLEAERVWHIVFGDIFDERRAAPPAYGRRAWSKVVSYLRAFRYVFRYWSEFRRRLNNKTVPNHKKLVKTMLGQLRNSFFGFEVSSVSTLCVVRKLFFWIDCFRWPEGPAETIQYARRNKKAVRNIQLHSNDAWLGWLTTTVEWNVVNCWHKFWENSRNVLQFTWNIL